MVRMGTDSHNFNDNTLATFFQLSKVGFVFIQMSITT